MNKDDALRMAMDWYDSGFEDRAAFQTLMESILEQPPQRTEQEPVQRTWVGLTDDELADCLDRAIEAKLKEKNTC